MIFCLHMRLSNCGCRSFAPILKQQALARQPSILSDAQIRVEYLKEPEMYIEPVLSRVRREHLLNAYDIPPDTTWHSADDFLKLLARKSGRLLKVLPSY